MPFQAVRSSRLYRQVAEQIAGLIESGDLAAGDRLPSERDLSAKLAVSRPTLREAMIALELEGLVEVRTGSGVYVTKDAASQAFRLAIAPYAGASPLELTNARIVIECAITAEAAQRIEQEALEHLRRTADAMTSAATRAEHQRADCAFHLGVAQASGNSVLVAVVETFWGEMASPIFQRFRSISGLTPEHDPPAILEHLAVLEALEARDPAAASSAMRTHLENVRSYLEREWKERELDRDNRLGESSAA